MTANISTQHALVHGAWRAVVSSLGASLLTLEHDGAALAASDWSNSSEWFAGATLAPWVNRLDQGVWSGGNAPVNDVANGCANHGLVFNRTFDVMESTVDSVTMQINCHDSAAYPFAILLTVTYSLCTSGLRVRVSAENTGADRAPFGVGGHPYLVAETQSVLRVNAATKYLVDGNMLPIGIESMTGLNIHPANKSDFVDTCFTDLERDPAGKACIYLTRPSIDKEVVLFQSKEFLHVQIFTLQASELTGHAALVAVEPQTSAANALRTLENIIWLEPGEQFAAQWGIRLEENHV